MTVKTGPALRRKGSKGFSLIESMIALLVMSTGLLAIAQLMLVTFSGPTLARSKSTAAMVAGEKLRFLAARYRLNPADAALTLGTHGPEQVSIRNPNDGGTLNRFNVQWTVSNVPDPRTWRPFNGAILAVRVTPIRADGTDNRMARMNKVINMTTVVSARSE